MESGKWKAETGVQGIAWAGEDPLGWWKRSALGMGGRGSRAGKIPSRSQGGLTYAATCSAVRGGPSYWCGLVSVSGVEGRAGLVTPAMKRSTSLIALSMERQG